MSDCDYSPQISPGNPFRTPPPATLDTIVRRSYITLSYPFDSPTLTLNLRNPAFNDKRVFYKSRIDTNSRNGDLIIFRDEMWPQATTLNMAFFGLSKAEGNAYLDFISASLGKYIRFTDWRTWDWKGIIIEPSNTITQEGRGCMYTAKLDFQGARV